MKMLKSKEERLYNGIVKICKKMHISFQKDLSYNGDWHLQFRKRYGYPQNRKYDFYGIEYTECYISKDDVQNRLNYRILSDLKSFLKISFKNIDRRRSQNEHSK